MKAVVMMSTYNGEKYICEQIDSIFAQTGDFTLDLWVRDDGSKDNTQKILQKYENDKKLQWYTGENLGASHSFIDLVRNCIGYDFYSFADQDDYWMPNKIQAGINALCKLDNSIPALYFANAELVDRKLESLGRNVYIDIPKTDFKTLCCAGGHLGCTMIFNAALAKIIQDKPMPGKIVLHDFYLAVVCAAHEGNIIFDATPYMKYRQHGNNVVGISHGLINTVIDRVKSIYKKANVSIAEQADTVIAIYGEAIDVSKHAWLSTISNYRKSVRSRLLLATSMEVKYINKNMGIKNRFSIFLGNR